MTIVKAAAVQISPVLYSREGTVQKVIQKIAELAITDTGKILRQKLLRLPAAVRRRSREWSGKQAA